MSGRRRLLAVSWEMPPLSGPRAVQVSRTLKYLAPLGWDSTVICFGARSRRYFPDEDLAARLDAGSAARVVRVPSPEERWWFRALWRICPPAKRWPDEKRVWIPAAVRAALKIARAERHDVLVTFAQPWSDHLIGLHLKRDLSLPWVAHFSDPWVDSPYLQHPRWQWRVWARMERAIVSEADMVVFVNRHTAERVMQKYPPAWRAKAVVVPHGFDRAMLPPLDRVERSPAAPLRLVYTGRFYRGMRTPDPVLRAAARVIGDGFPIEMVFAGPSEHEYAHAAAAAGVGAAARFVGRLPWRESIGLAAAADVLLVLDAPGPENLFLPSKLIEYLPLNRPILGVTPLVGPTADLVRRLGYPVAAPDDPTAIERALASLAETKRAGRLAPSAAHATIAAEYDIERTTAAFAASLQQCVGNA